MVGLSFASSILVATSLSLLPSTNAEGSTRGYSSSSAIVEVANNNDILSDIEGQDCSTSNERRCGDSSSHFCKKDIGTCSDTTSKSGVCTKYDDMFCIQSLIKVCGCDGVVYSNSCHAYQNGKNVMCTLKDNNVNQSNLNVRGLRRECDSTDCDDEEAAVLRCRSCTCSGATFDRADINS